MSGNAGRERPRRTYIDLIDEVLQNGQVRCTRNRRACMIRCMNVDPNPMGKRREFMYVCMFDNDQFILMNADIVKNMQLIFQWTPFV